MGYNRLHVGLLLIAAGATSLVLLTLGSGRTVVEAKPYVLPLDFGRQSERDGTVHGVIRVENPSRSQVTIIKVAAGCGCVSIAQIGDLVLSAGESGEIEALLERERMLHGKVSYPLVLTLKDGRRLSTVITYEYVPRIDINPGSLTLTADGAPSPLAITTAEELHLEEATSSDARIVIAKVDTSPLADGRVEQLFNVSASDSVGTGIEAAIELRLGDGSRRTVPVNVLGSSGERIQPGSVLFHVSSLDQGQNVDRQIGVRHPDSSDGTPRVESSLTFLEVAVSRLTTTTSRLVVTLPATARHHVPANGVEGELRVYLKDGDDPYATVRVLVVP